jgi:hypothetical protein
MNQQTMCQYDKNDNLADVFFVFQGLCRNN